MIFDFMNLNLMFLKKNKSLIVIINYRVRGKKYNILNIIFK